MAKHKFTVIITTDGMDGPDDMKDIATELESAIPRVVLPFVRETEPATVTWDGPVGERRKRKKSS